MSTTTINTTASGLPAEFADLEPFADWIIDTQDARYERRLASSMAEMQAFYDAMFPRLPAVMEYCNQYPIDDLPEPVRNLMLLAYSLIQISFPVEAWRQPHVPDAGAAYITCIREPHL